MVNSRAAAQEALAAFVPKAPLYAAKRNFVLKGHPHVSRLSAAIRHRLITEDEVAYATLERFHFSRIEKFIQEIYWRRYWKSWLSLRPQVWQAWRSEIECKYSPCDLSAAIMKAESGNALIDHFAAELIETGYLHNHARMWFAAWWVHHKRLPWQLGAAFFYRYLLDGDPASNTLSWRWVAGLQTPGKTYLARLSNLEKYLDQELFATLRDGLEDFIEPRPFLPAELPHTPITCPELQRESLEPLQRAGWWIHEEDLSGERPLGLDAHAPVIITADRSTWVALQFPPNKIKWLTGALRDAAARTDAELRLDQATNDALLDFARAHQLTHLVAWRPDVGPLADGLGQLRQCLAEAAVKLVLVDRPRDLALRGLARSGFFAFWQKLLKQNLLPHSEQLML